MSVGRSVVVDPVGVVEAELGLEPGVRVVEASPETVGRVRESPRCSGSGGLIDDESESFTRPSAQLRTSH